jgi:hypothetical protein
MANRMKYLICLFNLFLLVFPLFPQNNNSFIRYNLGTSIGIICDDDFPDRISGGGEYITFEYFDRMINHHNVNIRYVFYCPFRKFSNGKLIETRYYLKMSDQNEPPCRNEYYELFNYFNEIYEQVNIEKYNDGGFIEYMAIWETGENDLEKIGLLFSRARVINGYEYFIGIFHFQ